MMGSWRKHEEKYVIINRAIGADIKESSYSRANSTNDDKKIK